MKPYTTGLRIGENSLNRAKKESILLFGGILLGFAQVRWAKPNLHQEDTGLRMSLR